MKRLMIIVAGLMALSSAGHAATLPYDESADATAQVQQGLAEARQRNKQLLLVFGANWCPDCRALDQAFHGKVGPLLATRFVIVKVDVGNFDKHLDLSAHYGNPIQKGIPAAVIVNAQDQLLYSTKAGELANARRMSETGLYDFFNKVIADQGRLTQR